MRFGPAILAAVLLAPLLPASVEAHGGGGGGGHGGGGHYVYIPGYYGSVQVFPPAAKTGDYSGIHSVAIVSAIGQTLTLGSVALLASHKEIDVSDWKLDDFVAASLKQYLGGRFAMKDVAYDRAKLAQIPNSHFDTDSAKAVNAYLAALPSEGVDAYVVVRPDSEGGAPPTAGLSIDTPAATPIEVANFEIDVVDAKSERLIAHSLSRVALRAGVPPQFASIYGPAELKLTGSDTPSEAQRVKLKREFTKLTAFALLETLRSLDLGATLPAIGGRSLVPREADKAMPHVKSIAVYSAIGDSFAVAERGTFGGVSQANNLPIPDWQIDSHVESTIRAHLSKRLTVKDLPVDRAKLAQARVAMGPGAVNGPIAGLQPSSDVDLYLVILKHAPQSNNPVCMGLGVYGAKGLFGSNATAFACYDIVLADPHTLKPVFGVLGILSPAWPMPVPIKNVGGALWPNPPTSLTSDQSAGFKMEMTAFLDDSVPEMLLRLGLTDMKIVYIPGVQPEDAETAVAPPATATAASPTAAAAKTGVVAPTPAP
jgi:hypothetical protein